METEREAARRLYKEATASIGSGHKEDAEMKSGADGMSIESWVVNNSQIENDFERMLSNLRNYYQLHSSVRTDRPESQKSVDQMKGISYNCSGDRSMSADYQEKYLDARFASIDDKVGRIESEINEFRQDVKALIESERARTDALNARIDASQARVDSLKIWIVGTALALLGAVIGVMQIQNSWVIDSINRVESSVGQLKVQSSFPQKNAPSQSIEK